MERTRTKPSTTGRRRWLAVSLVLAGLTAVPGPADAASRGDRDLFALNMYHEARSGGREGMVAVGWVVLNRLKAKGFPKTIRGVILDGGPNPPCEWGWTCDRRKDAPAAGTQWRQAQKIAGEMLGRGRPADPTGGALWFHEEWRSPPAYTQSLRQTATIGGNVFYAR